MRNENALLHLNAESIRILQTLVSEPYINLGSSDFRIASVKYYVDSDSTVRLSVPYRSVRNRIGYRIVHFYTFLTRVFRNVLSVILSVCPLDSVQLRIRAVKFCTETRRRAARPYRTVLVSESGSTVLYRTVTLHTLYRIGYEYEYCSCF